MAESSGVPESGVAQDFSSAVPESRVAQDFSPAWDRREAGFSLAELLVATTVLMIISSITVAALLQMTTSQQTIWNRTQMHAGVRSAFELLQQEVGQAGRIALPGPTAPRLGAAITVAGAQTVSVTSTGGMFVGEQLVVGAGPTRETVTLTALDTVANTIAGNFFFVHPVVGGVLDSIAVYGGFATGIVPPTSPHGSTDIVLKLYGDINSDGNMLHIEYTCEDGKLYRNSMNWDAPSKPAPTDAQVLLTNLLPNPDGTPCFSYQEETVDTRPYVINVAMTLTVRYRTPGFRHQRVSNRVPDSQPVAEKRGERLATRNASNAGADPYSANAAEHHESAAMRNTMPTPTNRDNERGIALVLSLLLTLMMSVLAASLMFLSQTETYASMNYRMMSQARFGAESGVHKAVNFLLYQYDAPGGAGDPGGLLADYDIAKSPVVDTATGETIVLSANIDTVEPNYPNALVQATFEQAAQGTLAAGNGTVRYAASATLMSMQVVNGQTITSWEITSDGTIGGARPATVTVTSVLEKQLTPGPGTLYAAFATAGGCGALTWKQSATTDSYELINGIPVFGAPPSGGNVGTNGNMTAELNSKIYGSLATSKADGFGNCLEDGGFAASGGGAVHGAYVHLPQAVIMSVPVMPDPAPVFSQNISVDGSVTLMPGDYGNITLTSSPSTDLRLAPGKYNINSLTALGSARITVLDSQVIINIVDVEASAAPFRLESAIFPDPLKPYDARQLLINYAGTGDIIVQPLNGRFVGQINAPNAKVTINTDYYGSIIGSTVTFLGRKALHFDRNLSATPTFVVGPDMLTSFSWKKY